MSPLILVCDDDEDDRFLIKEAFAAACVEADFEFAGDGKELMGYLLRSSVCQESPRPDLILLDLNMPRMGGVKSLEWVKSQPLFLSIPVVIYTTSGNPHEILRCYQGGASAFITKCAKFEDLVEKIRAFAKYWMKLSELPGCYP